MQSGGKGVLGKGKERGGDSVAAFPSVKAAYMHTMSLRPDGPFLSHGKGKRTIDIWCLRACVVFLRLHVFLTSTPFWSPHTALMVVGSASFLEAINFQR